MKKILHILNTSSFSGAENVAITIIRNYSSEYEGIYLSPEGSIREWVEKDKIKYIGIKKLSLIKLYKVIKETKPDIIHAHDFTASIMASIVSKKIPVISHLHNNVPWMKSKNTKSILFKIILGKISSIIMVSEAIAKECWYGKKLREKGIVIGNPIDLKWINDKKSKVEKEYDLIFAGRLTEQKNPQEFIKIIKLLNDKKVIVRAVMIGNGELEKECKEMILTYGLDRQVDMMGFVKEPFKYMEKSKILLIPSKWEGFGLVAVEAMALGLPVIANPVGGLINIVTNDCGLLCTDIDVKIKEIEHLLHDEKYYSNKSKNALQNSEKIGKMDKYMDKLYNCYEPCVVKYTASK